MKDNGRKTAITDMVSFGCQMVVNIWVCSKKVPSMAKAPRHMQMAQSFREFSRKGTDTDKAHLHGQMALAIVENGATQ